MGEAVFSESPEKRLHSDPWSFPAFQGGTNWLLAGQTVLTEDGRRLNAGVLYFPSGFPAGYYAKTRPLPFAEWLPHPFFDSVVQSYAPGMQYFAIGDRLRPLPLAMLPSNATPREIKKALLEPARCARVGVLICFESSLPQLSYALCSQGASFLVVLSSNQTIQATAATRQHLAHDVVRAAECNVSVLRCANTGISAAISPKGQILGQLEVGSVDYIALDQVEMPDGITVAVKYHFGLLGIAVLLVLLSLASQFKLHTRASLKQSQESPR
jgi:apolipoprotein N-acyltransferase